MCIVLGVHFGHDASAAIVVDAKLVADVAEERLLRSKHSSDYPLQAISYCLEAAGVKMEEVDEIALGGLDQAYGTGMVFGHKADSPIKGRGLRHLGLKLLRGRRPPNNKIVPIYLRKHFVKRLPKVTFVEHHLAHAASAYFSTNDPRKMLIATVDGVGDGFSTCLWRGENGKITPLVKYDSFGSLGWFYSNVTEALGWWHGDGEGKTMGLAPYGDAERCRSCLDGLYPKFGAGDLVERHEFSPISSYKRKGSTHWHCEESLDIARLVQKYGAENVAAEAQRVLEEQVCELILPWLEKENTEILATCGGVFLNVKLNQRLWNSEKISSHYPYPNAGDSGLAVGAALYATALNGIQIDEPIRHLYWGPEYSNEEIEIILHNRNLDYKISEDVASDVAQYLAEDKIVGWFQSRMEAGPRALGNRSILMSPCRPENKDIINAKVKFREPFRPFCPSMISEVRDIYLVNGREEAYMVTSFDCVPERREDLPAVVHVDGTMRPQTVSKEINPRYWRLINEFGKLTGIPVVLNTSFNIRGEPIICHPRDAIRCFFDSGIDILALGDFILEKSNHSTGRRARKTFDRQLEVSHA